MRRSSLVLTWSFCRHLRFGSLNSILAAVGVYSEEGRICLSAALQGPPDWHKTQLSLAPGSLPYLLHLWVCSIPESAPDTRR